MGGEREQLESVEEILMGDEKFLSGGEGELLILGEELLEEGEEERWRGEEEGETWISRTLVVKHRVSNISKFLSYRAPLSSQDIFCRHHSALHLHIWRTWLLQAICKKTILSELILTLVTRTPSFRSCGSWK